MPFFIIFLLIPFTEIAVFMAIGEQIGLLTTLALAFLTAILGGAIIKHQGLQTLTKFRTQSGAGHIPEQEIFNGLCLVAAGAMLITPGFVTDTLGFLLLVPKIRDALRGFLKTRMSVFGFGAESSSSSRASYRYKNQDGDIIEGEFEDVSASGKTSKTSRSQIDKPPQS
jgi:UPF0716 protein FxsA